RHVEQVHGAPPPSFYRRVGVVSGQPLPDNHQRGGAMDFQADVEVFHGPLDLLLYLVKRDELDLRDIPISRLTEQFIAYLDVLKEVDVEQAGDSLAMARRLREWKRKMLLPRADEMAEEEDAPRRELVKQLLEYKRFKEAATLLEGRAEQQASRLPRIVPPQP